MLKLLERLTFAYLFMRYPSDPQQYDHPTEEKQAAQKIPTEKQHLINWKLFIITEERGINTQ